MARKISTLVPWYGSGRTNAHIVGAQLAGCSWVGVPFAGGMSEVGHITARTVVVGDKHRHLINLANVLRCHEFGAELIRDLRRVPFHEDALRHAQERCRWFEERGWDLSVTTEFSYEAALNYFVCAWMGRSGVAGTDGEFRGGLAVRWDAGGGDSATRFRSAVEGLRDWRRVFPRCTFVVRDCFEFLADVKDEPGVGLYCDPPWPKDGDKYVHKFTEQQQRDLAAALTRYTRARVVVRYGDHPLIRELYPEPHWRWLPVTGRTQAHTKKAEVLLVNFDPVEATDAA